MPDLNQVELQNLRHLIGAHDTRTSETKHICQSMCRSTN